MKSCWLILSLVLWGCAPDQDLYWTNKRAQSNQYLSTLKTSQSKIEIAILDTGFSPVESEPTPNFCERGHQDFTIANSRPQTNPPVSSIEYLNHGTNMVYQMMEILKDVDPTKYCLRVLKVSQSEDVIELAKLVQALKVLQNDAQVSIVNISSNSLGQENSEEKRLLLQLLNRGVEIVTSAGNDGEYLSPTVQSFPGQYDNRIRMVGNSLCDSCNWGEPVNAVAEGVWKQGGQYTSEATAVYSAQIARRKIEAANLHLLAQNKK